MHLAVALAADLEASQFRGEGHGILGWSVISIVTATVFLVAVVSGCEPSTSMPVSGIGGDAGFGDAVGSVNDSDSIDATATECAEQFVSGQFAPSGKTTGRFCLALLNGVTVNYSNCIPRNVSVNVEGPLYVSVGGAATMFASMGPTMIGFSIDGRGLPCAFSAESCQFRTLGAQCAATVIQSGMLDQMVEFVLKTPCELSQYDDSGNSVSVMRLESLHMRGILRLFQDVSTGSDGSVVDACQ